MLELFQWIQSWGFMSFIRESGWEYPIVMSTHLTCIAIFGGLIVITDLRLLGWAFVDKSIADVVNGLRWWKRIGFLIMFAMGFTLFGSKASEYYPNPYFWAKMSFLILVLIHAIIFRPIVYNHPEQLDASPVIPTRAKVAGALSLLLWTCVLCAGRLIGYWEPPSRQNPVAMNHFQTHVLER
ncbi:MAG TPA: DUF6644 family protein [Bryobacteraceae bacterium]|nr:DUF6644 family protein [Bryobacteraceae bacterium]